MALAAPVATAAVPPKPTGVTVFRATARLAMSSFRLRGDESRGADEARPSARARWRFRISNACKCRILYKSCRRLGSGPGSMTHPSRNRCDAANERGAAALVGESAGGGVGGAGAAVLGRQDGKAADCAAGFRGGVRCAIGVTVARSEATCAGFESAAWESGSCVTLDGLGRGALELRAGAERGERERGRVGAGE